MAFSPTPRVPIYPSDTFLLGVRLYEERDEQLSLSIPFRFRFICLFRFCFIYFPFFVFCRSILHDSKERDPLSVEVDHVRVPALPPVRQRGRYGREPGAQSV